MLRCVKAWLNFSSGSFMRVQQQRFGAITVFEVVMKENWTHYNHLDSVILKKFVWNKCNKNRMCTHAKPNDYCEKGPHVISSKKNACILHGFTGGNWQLFSPLASLSYKRHSYTMYDDHACVHGCSTWSHTSHSTIPFEIMGIKISESVDTTGWREIMTLVDAIALTLIFVYIWRNPHALETIQVTSLVGLSTTHNSNSWQYGNSNRKMSSHDLHY